MSLIAVVWSSDTRSRVTTGVAYRPRCASRGLRWKKHQQRRTHHSLVLDAVRDVPVWGNPPPSMTGWRILPEYAYQGLTERLASAEQRSTELQEQVNTLERVSDDHTTAINDMREQMTAERILQRRAMDDFKQEVYACGWPAPGSP